MPSRWRARSCAPRGSRSSTTGSCRRSLRVSSPRRLPWSPAPISRNYDRLMRVLDLAELEFSPTAALFEGQPRAGVGISMFIARTPPGAAVELHTHPYAETFLLLEGRGRWTAGADVAELEPNQMVVVPAHTPHGFRNIG